MTAQVHNPAGYVPQSAMAFGGVGAPSIPVDTDNPLPVALSRPSAGAIPLAGSVSASATLGPFVPALSWPIWVTLTGDWDGSAQLLRSTDGGATRVALTIGGRSWGMFTANANEPVAEESDAAASYWLDVTIRSGSLDYRVAQ